MAESNGLLDFVNSPAAMGLLAAGFGGLAGANRNTPVNNLGRAGLAGLTGYSAASALQGQRQKQEQLELRKKSAPGLFRTGADGTTTMDWQQGLALGFGPKELAGLSELPNAGRTKVARTMEVPSLGGGKQTIQLDDYGQAVGEARDAYVAPQLVDTGDTKQFVTPSAGQSFAVGMSPAEHDASARGWAGQAQNAANNPFMVVGGQTVPNPQYQQYQLDKASKGAPQINMGQKGFDNTLKLRSDFRAEPIYKAQQEMTSAYGQIRQSLGQASPAGDLAGATKMMKLLDPGSVVRESELGMAMQASGALDRISHYATNVINGTKLTPDQRKDFQSLSDKLYGESINQYNTKRGEYEGIASRNELGVEDVVGPAAANPYAAASGTDAGPSGAPKAGTIVDGHRFKGGNPNDPASWEAQ